MEEELHRKLKKMMWENTPIQGEMAKVVSVDEEKMECVVNLVSNPELKIEEVNLKAAIDGTKNGFIQIPKVGSIVLINMIENTEGDHYVSLYSDVEKVLLVQGNVEVLKVDSTGDILFHEGKVSGMVNAVALKEQLGKNNELLEAIINIINGSPVNEPGNGSPSALQLALKNAILNKGLGDFSSIENEKVKH